MQLSRLEGIGPAYAEALASCGIRSVPALLAAGASRQGRRDLARRSGLSEKLILAWVNRADLMRVRGVGEEYSDLLEAAGVDSVRELATRRPDNLYQSILRTNDQKHLVRRTPALVEVERWVNKAKELPPVITY